MRKETIDNVLIRIFGAIFGLGIALTGLLLFFVGIVFCTTVIGIIVGVPMIFCSLAFVPGGIIGAFEMAIKGKAEFKFLDKIKKAYTAKIETEPEPKDLRGTYPSLQKNGKRDRPKVVFMDTLLNRLYLK